MQGYSFYFSFLDLNFSKILFMTTLLSLKLAHSLVQETPNASWQNVVEALRKMDENRMALGIEKKYCKEFRTPDTNLMHKLDNYTLSAILAYTLSQLHTFKIWIWFMCLYGVN